MRVIVLKVVRAIDRVELRRRKRIKPARVTDDVGPAPRIDVEQYVFPTGVMRGNRDVARRTEVLATGLTTVLDAAMERGAIALVKPYTLDQLGAVIRNQLGANSRAA